MKHIAFPVPVVRCIIITLALVFTILALFCDAHSAHASTVESFTEAATDCPVWEPVGYTENSPDAKAIGDMYAVYVAYGSEAQRKAIFGCAKGSVESFDSAHRMQRFQNGAIFSNLEERTAYAVFSNIMYYYYCKPEWNELNSPPDSRMCNSIDSIDRRSQFGYPISSEIKRPNGTSRVYFDNGFIDSNGSERIWSGALDIVDDLTIPSLTLPFGGTAEFNGGPHAWGAAGALTAVVTAVEGSGLDFGFHGDVLAVTSGTVIDVQKTNCLLTNGALGCWVAIRSDFSGVVVVYGHLDRIPDNIFVGSWIVQGNKLGEITDARIGGYDPHLHLELRDGTKVPNASRNVRNWGQPIAWHGTVINDYLITAFFVDDLLAQSYNYDGAAVRNAPFWLWRLGNRTRYSWQDLARKTIELNTAVRWTDFPFFDSASGTKTQPCGSVKRAYGAISADAISQCTEYLQGPTPDTACAAFGRSCERLFAGNEGPFSTYGGTAFAWGLVQSVEAVKATVRPAGSSEEDLLNGPLLVSTNRLTAYVQKPVLPTSSPEQPSQPQSGTCPKTGELGVYLYSERQGAGECYFTISSVADLSTTPLKGYRLMSVRIEGPYVITLVNQNNQSETISHTKDNGQVYRDIDQLSVSSSPIKSVDVSTLLTNVVTDVEAATLKPYALSICDLGKPYYIDKEFVFSSFNVDNPNDFAGLPCILTAFSDGKDSSRSLLSFTLTQPARLYVFTDARITDLPPVLGDQDKFRRLGGQEIEVNDDKMGHFEVLYCDSTAGRVILPGPHFDDSGDGGDRMYVVAVDTRISSNSRKCGMAAPPPPSLQSPLDGQQYDMTTTSVTLTWTSEVTHHNVEVYGPNGYIWSSGWIEGTKTGVSVPVGYRYTWRVKARDALQQGEWSALRTFGVVPSSNTLFFDRYVQALTPWLYWQAVQDAEGYVIYRDNVLYQKWSRADGGDQWTFLGRGIDHYYEHTLQQWLFQDLNFKPNEKHVYRVAAIAGNTESLPSNEVKLFVPDFNGDTWTSKTDVIMVLRAMFDSNLERSEYDVNQDNKIDLLDVIEVIKYINTSSDGSSPPMAAELRATNIRRSGSDGRYLNQLYAQPLLDSIQDFAMSADLGYFVGTQIDNGLETGILLVLNLADPSAPALISRTTLSLLPRAIALDSDKAIIAGISSDLSEGSKSYRIQIYDTAVPAAPNLLGESPTIYGEAQGITTMSGKVLVAAGSQGLHIFNVNVFSSPVLETVLNLPSRSNDVVARQGTVFVATEHSGVLAISMDNVLGPYIASRVDTFGRALALQIVGSLAYVADGVSGVTILAVSDKGTMHRVAHYFTAGSANHITAIGNRIITADGWSGINLSELKSLSVQYLESAASVGNVFKVKASGDTVFVVDSSGYLYAYSIQPEPKLPTVGAAASSALAKWPAGQLIDGSGTTTWSSNAHGEHLASSEWAAVVLPSRTTVNSIRITPRKDPNNPTISLGFPKDFVIQYAYNGDGLTCDTNSPAFTSYWRPLLTRFGFAQPSNEAVTFTFNPVQAQCIRILGTELSQDDYGFRYLQFSEIEVFNDSTKIAAAGAAASSALTKWPAGQLIDGSGTTTWSSNAHGEHLASSEWAAVVLPNRTTVNSIRVTPRKDPNNPTISLGFPKDFVIQYAYNGDGLTCDTNSPAFTSYWRPLLTRFGFAQPSNEAVTFTFNPVQAQCIRILGTELSQDDYGFRYLQLSEIEVFNDSTKIAIVGAAASSALTKWPAGQLIDGSGTTTWSSNAHGEHLASSEWAAVVLPNRTTVNSIRITPRKDPNNPTISLGFPKDFVIQYAYNGDGLTCDTNSPAFTSYWRPLLTRFGFAQPSNEAVTFTFNPVQAQCIRILGTELSQDDYGFRYLQLSEIEVQ